MNELFWNDNVFSEGVGIKYKLFKEKEEGLLINQININAGHFIILSSNKTFNEDSYLQLFQLDVKLFKNRINIFPGFYYFKNIGNFPDGKHTYKLDYSIFHLGTEVQLIKKANLKLGLELYNNLQDYSNHESILTSLKDQNNGFVFTLKYGEVKKEGGLVNSSVLCKSTKIFYR